MSEMIRIRAFNSAGIAAVRQLLIDIRTDNAIYADRAKAILNNPNYTSQLKDDIQIDLERSFETKMDLIKYFDSVFDEDKLHKYKKNVGLWTWLAIAYYKQFLKTKKDVLEVAADCCWVYDPDEYRFARRHFVAGTVYLHNDFKCINQDGIEVFFAGAPNTFGGFIDAITYREEFARIPAMLQIAVWLYHDPSSTKKVKSGATNQKKPGTVRELTRMADQFAMTYDIFSADDASKLWKLLPAQFDRFKGDSQH
ncbi:MAG: hypothetical protein IKP97_01605 [Kiritimatiellae bacterium]|nr:hypothetical protein [Kiritimatiellia bacterium]